jgi:hypothetical protein
MFVISDISRNTFINIWWYPVNICGKQNPDIISDKRLPKTIPLWNNLRDFVTISEILLTVGHRNAVL